MFGLNLFAKILPCFTKQYNVSSLQEEALEKEVQSLRGEIVGAEERETTHLAQYVHGILTFLQVKRQL